MGRRHQTPKPELEAPGRPSPAGLEFSEPERQLAALARTLADAYLQTWAFDRFDLRWPIGGR